MTMQTYLGCWALASLTAALAAGGAHGQTGADVTLGPRGIEVRATAAPSPHTLVDMCARQNGTTYGRATLFSAQGVATAYGVRTSDGLSVLRTVGMASDLGADVLVSGTLYCNGDSPGGMHLGGTFRLGQQPTAALWSRDASRDALSRARLRVELDADD